MNHEGLQLPRHSPRLEQALLVVSNWYERLSTFHVAIGSTDWETGRDNMVEMLHGLEMAWDELAELHTFIANAYQTHSERAIAYGPIQEAAEQRRRNQLNQLPIPQPVEGKSICTRLNP